VPPPDHLAWHVGAWPRLGRQVAANGACGVVRDDLVPQAQRCLGAQGLAGVAALGYPEAGPVAADDVRTAQCHWSAPSGSSHSLPMY
jgi:hypothetical protein